MTLLLGGCACIVGGAVFGWRLPRLRELARPVYVERGILPEIAAGLSEAAALRDGAER